MPKDFQLFLCYKKFKTLSNKLNIKEINLIISHISKYPSMRFSNIRTI